MTQEQEYSIRLTPLALEMLSEIKDQRHLQKLRERIEKLKSNPEQQGKALTDNLKGYRSIRAVGQRYRIIYQVKPKDILILIVGVGLRKAGSSQDIYARIDKLLDSSTIDN
ncbi:type II toxin-antitoxin system RelE/ParE family toxin [Crocosphaera sp. XPORK-15E]|uniref:type II toxin-antitoxin system RelE family toxin n=1 Tax=Crocosphaera sp. XPORK-15E TaxID=3110247 RepID=UPI002B214216|nr:type II toxin-antitoxin system RelE/ParE family toxin [Crocosphaera sp. XPORK-15E]MEA5534729.1 type II toxin-antitoxin system RelE/ParE family toxin [Crocosphaera sp. XPORK-15E]